MTPLPRWTQWCFAAALCLAASTRSPAPVQAQAVEAAAAPGGVPTAEPPRTAPPPPGPPGPGASAQPGTAEPPAAQDDDIRTQLEALQRRLQAQEAENERQRSEIQALHAQAGAAPAASAQALGDEDAELAAFMANADDADSMQLDALTQADPLRLYGFMDVGWQKVWDDLTDTGLTPTSANNFVLGNVNLYMDANPAPDFRALVEVRFTTHPNGSESFDGPTATIQRHDTTVLDHTSSIGGFTALKWSALVLERAHADWTPSDLFRVRTGIFLTPYGIWNVDHGSPTRIMARPPFFVSIGLIPERQTGIEVSGTLHMLPWTLDYHVYVSNGATLAAVDFDEDKAIGGRLVLGTRRPAPMRFGVSFFQGSAEDRVAQAGVTASGTLGLVRTETVALDDIAGGADISIDLGALRIRAEVVSRLRRYEDFKRPLAFGAPEPDSTQTGGYFLAAYELPWYRLEPYAVAELVQVPLAGIAEGFMVGGGGLNIYMTTATQLRLFYTYAHAINIGEPDPKGANLQSGGARMVMAF